MDITAYVGFNVIDRLSSSPPEDPCQSVSWSAVRDLWKEFKNDRICLVTSEKDMETDIILWLNRQGCCITDTLRAMEAIDEFERWGGFGKEETKKWKRILAFAEQLDTLPDLPFNGEEWRDSPIHSRDSEREEIDLIVFMTGHASSVEAFGGPTHALSREDCAILRKCAEEFHRSYSEGQWRDLKQTHYQNNWDILHYVLADYHIEAVHEDRAGTRGRILFGLLNRLAGLLKKSSRGLPMEKSHIDFVIETVLRKYYCSKEEREAYHIINCLRHGIAYLLTDNESMIETYKIAVDTFKGYRGFPLSGLTLIHPVELKRRVLDRHR